MSALGRLVASVVLDTAEFTQGADKAKYTAAATATAIDKSFKDAEQSINSTLRKIAAGLATGFTIAAIKSSFDGVVAFRAELEKLSTVTGASVESLSKIGQGAKLAGTDMGTVETALVKLTKGLTAANADTKDTSNALAYLGLSAKDSAGKMKDPGDLMLEISKRLGAMENSSNKTAIALALFGKSGAQMLPVLKQLADNGDLIAKVTERQANEALEYEKALVRLSVAQGAVSKKIVGEFVVPMTTLIQVFTDSIVGADSLNESVTKLSHDGSLKLWAEQTGASIADFADVVRVTAQTLMAIGSSVNSVAADMALASIAITSPFNSGAIATALEVRNTALATADKRWQDLLNINTKKTREAYDELLELNDFLNSGPKKKGTGKPDFVGTGQSPKESAYKTENAALDQQIAKLRGVGELEAYLTKLEETRFDTLTKKERESLVEKKKTEIALQQEIALRALLLKSDADLINAMQKINDEYQNYGQSLRDTISGLEFQNDLIGKSTDQIAKATEMRRLDLELRTEISKLPEDATSDQIDRLIKKNDAAKAQVAILLDTGAALKNNQSLWLDVADRGSKLFVDMLSSGKNAFKTLTDELKNFGRELLAFFAKRYILQMGAAMIGGTSGAALANTASTLGNGSLVGSIGNAFSSGSSLGSLGSGIYGLFGGGGGSAAGSMAWAGGGWGGADVAATAAGSSGMLGSMGSMLAAGGPYIAAALAIYALVKQFGDKGENAQSRLGFGTGIEGGGTGGYQIDGYFGKEGFQSSTMPTAFNLQLLDYFKSTGTLDKQIGGLITAQQREAITGRLNGFQGNQYAFATGDNTGTEQLSLEYLKTKYSQVFAEINTGFASSIGAFSGTSEDLLKKIGGFVTAFELVKSSIESLRATAASLTDPSGLSGLVNSLTAMRKSVTDTRDEFNAAVYENTDMARIAAAEDAYTKAVLNRYNTEMQLVNNLVATLRQINSERYGAAKDMAGRFASIDGTDYQGAANRAWTYASGARQSLANVSDPATRLAIVADGLKAWDDWFAANRDRIQAGADEWRKITANETAALNEQLSLQQIQLAGLQKMKDLAQQASDSLLGTSLSSANPASAGIRYQLAGENIAQLQSMFAMTTGDTKIGYGQKLISAAQDRLNSAGSMYDRPSAEYQDAYNSAISIMAQVQQSAMDAAASIPSVEQSIADTMAGIREQSEILKSIDRLQEAALQEYKDTYRLGLEFAQGVQLDAFTRLQETAQAQLNAITGGLNSSDYLAQLTQGTHVRLDFIANVLESRVIGALDRLTAAVTTSTTTTTTTGGGGGGGTGSGGGGNGTDQSVSIPIELTIDGQAMEGFVVKAVIRNGSVIKREFVNA